MKHLNNPIDDEVILEAHRQLAREQMAMHATKLALARWMSGNPIEVGMGREKDNRPSIQAVWHATAQRNFNSWLAAGGFSKILPRTNRERLSSGS